MNFNSHKSWHVHNKGNQNRKEKVTQKQEEHDTRILTMIRDREREKDMAEAQRMAEKFQKSIGDKPLEFLYEAPPGMVKEEVVKPEDSIPDLPENKEAREFLKQAPSKGLWMPLGKEVKVMQCWRCKAYGHRTGDRECPLAFSGNSKIESERQVREDPMTQYLREKKDIEEQALIKKAYKLERLKQLQALLEKAERRDMKKKLERKMKKKEKKKKEKKNKKRKHSESESESESESSSDSSSSSDSESSGENESDKNVQPSFSREREKEKERDNGGVKEQDEERGQKDREYDNSRETDRDRGRQKEREKGRERYDRGRDTEKDQERDRDRDREKERNRDRDKNRDHYRHNR